MVVRLKKSNTGRRIVAGEWSVTHKLQTSTSCQLNLFPFRRYSQDLMKYPKFMVAKTLTWTEHRQSGPCGNCPGPPDHSYLITAVLEIKQAEARIINLYFPEELLGDYISYYSLSGKFWWFTYQKTEEKNGSLITVQKSEELFFGHVE